VKIRPLPDIDLARIAPQPNDVKRRSLQQIRFGRPTFSYRPVRSLLQDIFNIQPGLFGPVEPTEWAIIAERLKQNSANSDELAANEAVARSLYDYAIENELSGRQDEFLPMAMGAGIRVRFWEPVVLALCDRPSVPFLEPRRSRGLGREGRRFAFSMMHERIRTGDPDYANVCFAIFQFGSDSEGKRPLVMHLDHGIELYSLYELEQMVAETYEIWREVCDDRSTEMRKKAAGATGSLL